MSPRRAARRGDLRGRRPTPREAAALQEELRGLVVPRGPARDPGTVGGVDVSVRRGSARAAVVVLAFPSLEEVDRAVAERPVEFPYVPGLLAFREMPAILDAFETLRVEPELVMVDGHGYAHPRRFGVACHAGVTLGRPSIGIGKTRFVGEHREPGQRRGARVRLLDRGEVIGRVVRTRDGVKPIFVSVGHRIALDRAVRLTLRCCTRYRLPEPIRAAHRAAGPP